MAVRSLLRALLAVPLVVVGAAAQAGPGGSPPQDPPPRPPAKVETGKPAAEPGKPGQTEPGKPAEGGPAGPKAEPKKDEPPADAGDETVEEIAIPASADPADVAAMRSAQAMLQAEARLRKLLKAGEIKGIDKILTFEEISNWPYEDGLKGVPEAVKKMDAKQVMMTGFMLPIDEVQNIKEFLLVQSLWSCCYGQPPDINGIVRVVMQGDKRIDYMYDPIKVVGKFKVEAAFEDGYCIDIYQLHADSVETIK